ncbi:hypothetical protein E8E15_000713 [Penicillium rubens]|nr:hypothetical protein E8E15_000713 [Penicillium rubens]
MDRQSFYRSLDRKKYEDAKAGFMFCGSMFEAYTIVSKSDVPVQPGNFHCLDLASQTVDALVFNIDNEHTKNWSNEARGTSDTVSYDSMDGTNQEHTQARC